MTTLDAVAKKKAEPSAEQLAAVELVRMAKEQGLSPTGPEGLLQQLTETVLETALNEEMTEHLGYEPNQAPEDRDPGNVRNGTRSKTVLTETTGPVPIEVPRDRDGSFQRGDPGRGERAGEKRGSPTGRSPVDGPTSFSARSVTEYCPQEDVVVTGKQLVD